MDFRPRNQDGQATTEYVLLLAVVVGMFLTLVRLLGPAMTNLSNTVQKNIKQALFSPAGFHQFKVSK